MGQGGFISIHWCSDTCKPANKGEAQTIETEGIDLQG